MSAETILVQSIPLAQIRPNPNNPPLNQGDIDLMAASLAELGQETDAKVRSLTEEEKTLDPDHLYELIGGHLRMAATQKLGWATLNCKIFGKTLAEATKSAFLDNKTRKRSWLEDDLDIGRIAKMNDSVRKTADELGVSKSRVHDASVVANALTPASIALIRQNLAQTNPSDEESVRNSDTQNKAFLINEWMVRTLADLGDPQEVEKALPVVLDHHLIQPQVKKLVEWVKAGNSADSYSESAQPKRVPRLVASAQASETFDPQSTSKAVPSAQASSSNEAGTNKSHAPATHADVQMASKPHAAHTALPVHEESAQPAPGTLETAGWDLLAGIPVAAQIRAKIKKGERPSLGETFILVADVLWKAMLWTAKHSWKLMAWFLKETWRLSKVSLKDLFKALGKKVYAGARLVLAIGFFAVFIWLGWAMFTHGPMYPVKLLWAKVHPVHETLSNPSIGSPTEPIQPKLAAQPEASPQVPTAKVMDQHKKTKVAKTVTTVQMTPTQGLVQITPTVKKGDVLGDVAKGANAVGGVAKLFGL